MGNDEKIYSKYVIDNTYLKSAANQTKNILQELGDSMEKEGMRIDNTFKRISGSVLAFDEPFTLGAMTRESNGKGDGVKKEVQNAEQLKAVYEELADMFLTQEERKLKSQMNRLTKMREESSVALKSENITDDQFDAINLQIDSAELKTITGSYLDEVTIFKEKEQEIITRYDKAIAIAEAAGNKEKADMAKGQRDQALADLQLSQEQWYKTLFGSLETHSSSAVLSAIAKAKEYVDNYKKTVTTSGRKLAPEEVSTLGKIEKATSNAEVSVRNKIPAGLKQTSAALREVASLAGQFDKTLSGNLDTIAGMTEGFGSVLQGVSDFKKAQDAIKAQKEKPKEAGEKTSFGDVLGNVGAYAGAAGAVIGGVSKIIGLFKGFSKSAKLAEQEVRNFYMTAYLGAKAYDAIVRQQEYQRIGTGTAETEAIRARIKATEDEITRLESAPPDSKFPFVNFFIQAVNKKKIEALRKDLVDLGADLDSIGGGRLTSWEAANMQMDKLRKNIAGAITDNTELLGRLRNQKYISGEHTKSTWLGLSKKVVKEWSSLAGKSVGEIEKLYSEGKLSDQAKKLYDAWKKSGEEIDKWSDELEDVQEKLEKMAVGGSFDDFLSDFSGMLAKGMVNVEDFANFTEDTIRKAILSSFKYKVLESALRPYYDKLTEMFSGDGMPKKEDLLAWADEVQKMAPELAATLTDIANSLGIDLPDNDRQATAKGIATASQESVDVNNGLLTAIQGHTYLISEGVTAMVPAMQSTATHLSAIQNMTEFLRGTVASILEQVMGIKKNTDRLETIEKDISSVKAGIDEINLKGITLKR